MKKDAYITINAEDIEYVSEILNGVLACLRAQSLSYQTSHWQVAGSHFYQEHLLLERLYNSVREEIDVLAEKISGYVGSDQVSLENQIPKIAMYLGQWAKIPDHLRRGLASEELLQELLKMAFDDLQETGLISLGLEDWLAATASAHETNIYLLQQIINPRAKHITASRSRVLRRYAENESAADLFFSDPRRVEVSEFAESNSITNDETTFENFIEDGENIDPVKVELGEYEESPYTPDEIVEMPGGDELSTLNRFVVDSENPDLNNAIKMNEKREDIAITAMVRRVIKASLSRGIIRDINKETDVHELASFYSMGESMLDFDWEDASEIMRAVEARIKELGLEEDFDKLI